MRRMLGGVLIALASVTLVLAVLLPATGEAALRRLRGRDVQADSGRRLFGKLLLVVGAGGSAASLLVFSSGLLLCRREPDGVAVPLAPTPAKVPRTALLAVAALLVAFLVMAAVIACRSFNYDEILAMSLDVKVPLTHAFRPHGVFANHYTGTLLARASVGVGGDKELAARAGSIATAVLGISLACVAGVHWGSRWLAFVWPALFLGGHAFVLSAATQIRGYSPLMTGSLAVAAGAALAVDSSWRAAPRWKKSVVVGLVGVAALALGLAHLFGLIYLGFLTLLVHVYAWTNWHVLGPEDGGCRGTINALAALLSLAFLGAFLAWTPALPWLFYNAGGTTTPALLRQLPGEMATLFAGWENLLAGTAVAVLLIAATVWAAWKIPPLRIAAITALFPLFVLLAAAFVYKPMFLFARFFAPVLPLTVLCAAASLGRWQMRSRYSWLAAGVLIGSAAAVVPGSVALFRATGGIREGMAQATRLLRERGDADSRFIFLGDAESDPIVSYYAPPERCLRLATRAEWDARRQAGLTDLLVTIGDSDLDGRSQLPPDWNERAHPLPSIPTGERQSELRVWLIGEARSELEQ